MALVVLILLQIYLGALVAGLRAGLIYNTWPLIDGSSAAGCGAAVLPRAVVAQFLRECADGAVRSPDDGLRAADRRGLAQRSTSRARTTNRRYGRERFRSSPCCWCRWGLGSQRSLYSVPILLGACASGGRDRGADRRRAACGKPHAAPRRCRSPGRRWRSRHDRARASRRRRDPAHGARQGQRHEHRILPGADRASARSCAPPPARAVILTGTGRIFSAGVDLPRLIEGGVPYIREFLPALNAMLAAVFSYPKPVVAAINGHAIAGGCVLACAADRRLMAKDGGRIGVTELLVGVPFPAAAMEIMRHATAPQYFEHAIFSGATFTPEDAAMRGLVDEVVEPRASARPCAQRGDSARRAVAGSIRTVEAADPPAVARPPGARRRPHRRRGHANLVRARHARPDQGLCRAHAQEGLKNSTLAASFRGAPKARTRNPLSYSLHASSIVMVPGPLLRSVPE